MKRLKARRMELEDKKITSWNEKTKLRSENSNFRKERWGILFFQICWIEIEIFLLLWNWKFCLLRLICLLNKRFPARWNRERIGRNFYKPIELIFRASLLLIGFRPILMEHGRNLINPFGLPVNQVSYASSCVTRNWNFSLRNNFNVEISRFDFASFEIFFVILFILCYHFQNRFIYLKAIGRIQVARKNKLVCDYSKNQFSRSDFHTWLPIRVQLRSSKVSKGYPLIERIVLGCETRQRGILRLVRNSVLRRDPGRSCWTR